MSKKVKFTPFPNAVPEGTKEGDTFDLTCTFRLEDSGDVCMTKMGDVDAPDTKDEKSMIRPGMDDEIQAMQSAMMADGANSQAM